MKIFICTAGTSIATNKNIDIKAIENKPFSDYDKFQIPLLALRQQVEDFLSKLDLLRELDQTSAEIKSLAKMGLEKGDRVFLLVSDTVDGMVCAKINKEYLIQNWNCEVSLEKISGLQSSDSKAFSENGLKNLLDKVISLLEKYSYQEVCLNITAGYKSTIPYLTLLGMLYDKPIKYIYEKSDEIITLEKIPLKYDEETILAVEDKLLLIEKDTEISLDLWEQGIPFEKRKHYSFLMQESGPGRITMSAIGLIFYEKFKTDYPPELVRDLTPPKEKDITLREDKGKDILFSFSKKIVNSPFVKGVINSLPFNPQRSDPIKKCFNDGEIEIVLVKTDPGYGIVVQTTGRNMQETERIAKLLQKKYLS